MTYAAITGWGKCMPPAVLSNADLATFLDTTDEWIVSRTGMKERRISHVPAIDMASVAAARALACAGLDAADVDLIVYGSCSNDETVPNSASGVQVRLGATQAASMDINTACTSFLYGLSTATALLRTGVVRNAVVIGVELISPYMDWDNRGVAVLFGDGCAAVVRNAVVIGVELISPYMDWDNRGVAVLFGDGCAAVVLQASDEPEGLLGEKLGCDADARHILRVRGMGCTYANRGVQFGDTLWDFDGQEIFKKAVKGMAQASQAVLARCGVTADQIDLVVPHQANLRIIESVAKHTGLPMDKVFVTVQRYGNMSAATVPVALVEALEAGRVQPGALILMPGFGGGLTLCSHLVRWGQRVTPLATSDAQLPPCEQTALEIVNGIRAMKDAQGVSLAGLSSPVFAETVVDAVAEDTAPPVARAAA